LSSAFLTLSEKTLAMPSIACRFHERWSQNFGPVVKVDRMKKVTIQNEETKEPFAGIQSQGCA
jgi:uncharacterized protein YmfQ (DUF2313 family)